MLYQTELVNLDDLVIREHSYRGFKEVFDYRDVIPKLRKIEKEEYYKGYGAYRLFKCCLLQFLEDLSDRQMERFIRENNAAKWFCDFGLTDKTPDHTVLCRFRKRLGSKVLSEIFVCLRDQRGSASSDE